MEPETERKLLKILNSMAVSLKSMREDISTLTEYMTTEEEDLEEDIDEEPEEETEAEDGTSED